MDYAWLSFSVLVAAMASGACYIALRNSPFNPHKNDDGIPVPEDVVYERTGLVFCGGLVLKCETPKEVAREKDFFLGNGERTKFSEVLLLGLAPLVISVSDFFSDLFKQNPSLEVDENILRYCNICACKLRPSDFLAEIPNPELKQGIHCFSYRCPFCKNANSHSFGHPRNVAWIRRRMGEKRFLRDG